MTTLLLATEEGKLLAYDRRLYTTIAKRNEIWIYDLELNLLEKHRITPPFPDRPAKYKENYNHLNNIIRRQGKIYVNLNWFTSVKYGCSGVVVLQGALLGREPDYLCGGE